METVKRISLVLLAITFGVLLIFQFVNAEIYKWVDEKGTVNFTEDPETIPEKYRDKAKSRTTEEDLMTLEEKIRARKKYEEEVRERLKREGKENNANEFEKRVKEIEGQAKKKREEGRCEIISYSQYDVMSNVVGFGGHVAALKSSCVELVIQNNSPEPKTITQGNIVAITSKVVKTQSGTKNKFNPNAVFIQIRPGETYRGSICFKNYLSIAKLELQGL